MDSRVFTPMLFLTLDGYVAMSLHSVGQLVNQADAVRPCMVLFTVLYAVLLFVALLRAPALRAFVEFSLGALATTAVSAVLVVTQVCRLTPSQLLVVVLASGLATIIGRALTRPKGVPSLAVQVAGWQSVAAHNERAADAMERLKADVEVVNTFKAAAVEAQRVVLVLEQERRQRSTGTP